jgi:hypothetical protein
LAFKRKVAEERRIGTLFGEAFLVESMWMREAEEGRGVSLVAFAHHLAGTKAALMERWRAAVFRDAVPSARELSKPRLWDHMPAVLDEIILAVGGKPTPTVKAEGEEHGRQRWASGYEISEVLRELADLRDVLQEVTAEYAAGTPGLDREEERAAYRRIQIVIDRGTEAAMSQYFAETLAVRQLLEEELRLASEQKDRFLAMLSHELCFLTSCAIPWRRF